MKAHILKFLVLMAGLFPFLLKAQMKPLEKVFIIEGIVADKETLEVVPSVIIFNDTLGITTTSDENGYFKVVVPFKLISERQQLISIDIVKSGYKRNGWGISSLCIPTTIETTERPEVWNYDVQILFMAKNSSTLTSTSMAHAPAEENVH
jgi:hypothetical protein